MMLTRRLLSRALAIAAVSAAAGFTLPVTGAHAETPVKFTLDWKFEGPAAGFLLALDKGYFKAEGLDVTIDSGNGSVEAIPRVATGAYQMGFGDINSVMKFLDEDPSQKIRSRWKARSSARRRRMAPLRNGLPLNRSPGLMTARSRSNRSASRCVSRCWPRAMSMPFSVLPFR